MEVWKGIPGCGEKYEVSDCGRVRRIYQDARKPKVLKPQSGHKRGYLHVSLYLGGRMRSRRIHRIVARAFLGERPDGMVTNHKDFDPTNNHLDNLEYVTPIYNTMHSYLAGRMHFHFMEHPPIGENHANAKLAWKQIRQMRQLWKAGGWTKSALGEKFGVTHTMACYIINGKSWKEPAKEFTDAL